MVWAASFCGLVIKKLHKSVDTDFELSIMRISAGG